MKSAEEWTDTDLNRAIFSHGEEVYKVVKARDLEMWKQGMTDAAENVHNYHHALIPLSSRNLMERTIISKRDTTKTV